MKMYVKHNQKNEKNNLHYVKVTNALSFQARFRKIGPSYRRQVLNPRHQTPQGPLQSLELPCIIIIIFIIEHSASVSTWNWECSSIILMQIACDLTFHWHTSKILWQYLICLWNNKLMIMCFTLFIEHFDGSVQDCSTIWWHLLVCTRQIY